MRACRATREPPDLARAGTLFDAIAQNPDIPHDFVHNGCHLRAHAAAYWLEGQGVESFKVFAVPQNGELRITAPRSEPGFTVGRFHAAVAVPVATDEGVVARIFDPALFDEPVTAEAWAAALKDLAGGAVMIHTLPRFAFLPKDAGRCPSHWRAKDLAEAHDWKNQVVAERENFRDGKFVEMLRMLDDRRE